MSKTSRNNKNHANSITAETNYLDNDIISINADTNKKKYIYNQYSIYVTTEP